MTDTLNHLAVLSEPVRGRLLLALEEHELSVGELAAALQLPQSTVSRHLKALGDDGWVTSRADGTSRYYRRVADGEGMRSRLWAVVRADVTPESIASADRSRVEAVVEDRRRRSREYFSALALQWDDQRARAFGERADLALMLAALPASAVVADLGCGTGHVTALVAPSVSRVIGVDSSPEMLEAAQQRTLGMANVEFRRGELAQLPLRDGEADLAMMALVLNYVSEPVRVFAEVRRTLSARGRLVVLDTTPGARGGVDQGLVVDGSPRVWPGFEPEGVGEWLIEAGFKVPHFRVTAPDTETRGPMLFTVSAGR